MYLLKPYDDMRFSQFVFDIGHSLVKATKNKAYSGPILSEKTPNLEKQTNIVVAKCAHPILSALLLAYSDLSFLIASCYLETLQIRPLP